MKFLTVQDLDVEDSLDLYWEGTFDPQLEVERALEPFFQALEEYAGEWMPDFVEGKRRRKYTRAAVWKTLEESRDEVRFELSGSITRRIPSCRRRSVSGSSSPPDS